jgi:hypothetical protein
MMPNMLYQQWEIERTHTLTEQRAADRRRGEIAAAVSGSLRRIRRLRLRVRYPVAPSPVTTPARVNAVARAVAK